MIRTGVMTTLLVVLLAGCNGKSSPTVIETSPTVGSGPALPTVPAGPPLFEEKTDGSGVAFTYRNGEESKHMAILESLGGGAALIDFDGDGLLDLFVPGGGWFDGPDLKTIRGHAGKFYRNLGNFQFEDVTDKVGLRSQPDVYTHGATVGDFDRDGWPDLLVTGYGRVTLWHNQPDGLGGRRFVDVTEKAGLLEVPGGHFWSTSAAFGDLDGDGFPDLYLCQYVNWSFQNHPPCPGYHTRVKNDVCPPKEFAAVRHALWHNKGDGTFEDVSAAAGLRLENPPKDPTYCGKGLGVLFVDVDGDGKPDIYVCNDTTDNFLYLNRSTPGKLRFEDKGLELGVARDSGGAPQGSMGVDAGAYDGADRPSIFVTNYESEFHALYRSQMINNRLTFNFSTQAAGLSVIGPNFVGWGTKFIDVDSDGWEDILIANGHVVYYPPRDNLRQKPVIFMNREHQSRSGPVRRFIDGTARGGSYFARAHRNRGVAVGDLDNDGRLDLVFVPVNEPIAITRGIANENGWLGVELHSASHRDFVGAKLTLEVGGRPLVRFVKGGGSYASAHDPRVLFGLGQEKKVGKLTIEWPHGKPSRQEIDGLTPGKYHRIEQK